MRYSLVILLFFMLSCKILKPDTTKTIFVTDTVARKELFKVSKRVSDITGSTPYVLSQANYKLDSMVAASAENAIKDRIGTIQKNANVALSEAIRLESLLNKSNDRIRVLEDSLSKLHYLWVDPLIGTTVRGQVVDSLIKQQ